MNCEGEEPVTIDPPRKKCVSPHMAQGEKETNRKRKIRERKETTNEKIVVEKKRTEKKFIANSWSFLYSIMFDDVQ
jgi:hypothetical protein